MLSSLREPAGRAQNWRVCVRPPERSAQLFRANPMSLKRGIESAVERVSEELSMRAQRALPEQPELPPETRPRSQLAGRPAVR
jgi:hypothetical protein